MFKSVLIKVVRANGTLHYLAKKITRRGVGRGMLPSQENKSRAAYFSMDEFRHLFKLKNYRSASELLKRVSFEELSLGDQLRAIRCLYAVADGVKADFSLKSLMRKFIEQKGVTASLFFELVENIRLSGIRYDEKVDAFRNLEVYMDERYPADEVVRLKFKVSQFYLALESDVSVSPLEFVRLSDFSVGVVTHCSGAFSLLLSYGYHCEVFDYLNRCLSASLPSFALIRIVIRFMPEWFDEYQEILLSAVSSNKNDIALLQALYLQRKERECFGRLYQECLEFIISNFYSFNIYQQDKILNFLLRSDLWDEALDLVGRESVPDTVLSKVSILGFRYLNLGDYGAALHCFQRVLEEDASDSLAANGFRFAAPRAGFNMQAVLEYRAKIGYGVQSSGRKALVKSGSEFTTIEAMSGNYITYYSSKRNLARWRVLSEILGDSCYFYKLLPDFSCKKSLYVIADEGVGDEIRSSQFYGGIQGWYGHISASCDPRLVNIFSRSFSNIEFFPVRRVRKSMATRSDTLDVRLAGVSDRISGLFSEDAYAEMQRADYVTNAQSLMFNHFAGIIARPERGGYLKWDRSTRIAPSGKLKIGILWRSHLMVGMRKLMYLRVEDFAPLTELDGVEIWSIQHAMTEAETKTCRDLGINLLDDVDLFNDFEAMAGCLLGLDLLIGISSVPMELGAALGIETWMLGFSPENYYLRTAGGKTEVDQLTLNSTVVAPAWIDFTETQEVCVREVFDEVKRRLAPRLASLRAEQVVEG